MSETQVRYENTIQTNLGKQDSMSLTTTHHQTQQTIVFQLSAQFGTPSLWTRILEKKEQDICEKTETVIEKWNWRGFVNLAVRREHVLNFDHPLVTWHWRNLHFHWTGIMKTINIMNKLHSS